MPFSAASRAETWRRAGAQEVWLGVESGSQRILDAMDKGTRVEAARLATRRLKEQGIRAGWFLQLGYPPEEWGDILLTRDLVRDEAPPTVELTLPDPIHTRGEPPVGTGAVPPHPRNGSRGRVPRRETLVGPAEKLS